MCSSSFFFFFVTHNSKSIWCMQILYNMYIPNVTTTLLNSFQGATALSFGHVLGFSRNNCTCIRMRCRLQRVCRCAWQKVWLQFSIWLFHLVFLKTLLVQRRTPLCMDTFWIPVAWYRPFLEVSFCFQTRVFNAFVSSAKVKNVLLRRQTSSSPASQCSSPGAQRAFVDCDKSAFVSTVMNVLA